MVGEGKTRDKEPFHITSLQDAEDFAANLSRYGATIVSGYDVCKHIEDAYKYSRVHCEDQRVNGKLFNAYIDLELNYIFMMKDIDLAGGKHSRLHKSGKLAASVLEDYELFSGKLEILCALSALSFRTRAFWDKGMGILFLLYEFRKYEKFVKTRSRKAYSFRNAQDWPEISPHFQRCFTNVVRTWLVHSEQREAVKDIDDRNLIIPFPDPFLRIMANVIEMVDDIRTPEAHGAGFLRKWTLSNFPIDKSRDFSMINHWNVANEFMHAIRATIGEYAAEDSSPR